ncbi:restriction endonuclease subunit S [Hallella colorans]|nr:restriction endonuclease subunit S [Hallella colorans]
MNGKQLKNSILQWAIQGKLVPQDPNDEPASVLLKKIRQEKERLIKEKKIKRDKNASIIYRGDDNSYYEKILATGEVKCIDDEVPFEIPQGWEWCRLKHICSMQAGKNISASKIFLDSSVSHPYRCVGGNGMRGYTEDFNTHGHYSIVGRQGALCGCVNIEKGKFYATEHAVVVDTYEILSPLFMYYFLTALNLNKYATATAQPGLAVSNVLEVMCPLPPLNEGERIIKKLSLLIPLIENYNVIQEKQNTLNDSIKEQLKISVLQEAIQGKLVPQIVGEGTAQELLEQIKAEKLKLVKEGKLKKSALNDSVIFRGDDNKYYEQIRSEVFEIELPFDFPSSWFIARLNAVCQLTDGLKTAGKQCLLDAKYLRGKSSETIIEKGKLVCKGDNIILVDGENSGEVFNVPQDGYMGSTFKQLWIGSSMFEPYVLAFIRFYKETLRNSKKGAAIPHLNKELFYGLIIGIPPLQEQRRIVQKIEESAQLLK